MQLFNDSLTRKNHVTKKAKKDYTTQGIEIISSTNEYTK